jgi:hypothetical protein
MQFEKVEKGSSCYFGYGLGLPAAVTHRATRHVPDAASCTLISKIEFELVGRRSAGRVVLVLHGGSSARESARSHILIRYYV